MSLRRITANISKMDILLALAAGVVMFSYFIPTIEAYNPKEQQGKYAFMTYRCKGHG